MNIQLIERIIRSNNDSCPEFAYNNPLLDKDFARALSKSFVKILNISKQNSNINNNLRLSILENIRKLCQIEPEDHAKVDEKFTELLTDFYQMKIEESKNTSESAADKELEAFLVRKMKNIAIESSYQPSVNPEIIQALINLNKNGVYFETLSKDVVHWNSKSKLYACLLKDLRKSGEAFGNVIDDISIKMKADIERTLLESIQTSLQNNSDVEKVIRGNNNLMELIQQCSISPECFQICSGILNFLFIMTNFEGQIQNFISEFTTLVKSNCAPLRYSTLYPMNLASTVVLLDFDIDSMPEEMKQQYAQLALGDLEQLQKQSENDFVLLLSHFPQWFDVYFKTDKINSCSQASNDDVEMIL